MQKEIIRSSTLEIDEENYYDNLYESEEGTPRESPTALEEKINKYLDSMNAHICDPLDKINDYFKKKHFFIFNKQESRGTNTGITTQSSLKEFTFCSLPSINKIDEDLIVKEEKRPSVPEEMILKGVDSFKLVRRRKTDLVIKEEEKK